MSIIDFHVHPAWQRPVEQTEDLLRVADRNNVEKIVFLGGNLGFGYKPTSDQIRQINDLTIDLVERWPDRLIGFVRLNAGLHPDLVRGEIDRCVVDAGFRGIKLAVWPNARDSRLDPVMERARELEIPVLHHCWYKTVQKYDGESDPSDIAHLAARFPDVTLVAAHLTPAGCRGVQDILPYENVHIDTSGAQPFAGHLEYAIPRLGAHRILYGSDAPGRDIAVQLGRVIGAEMSDRERELILSGNARRLLKLI